MMNLHAIGRALYALPLGVFAFMHFANAPQMAGFVPAWVPGSPVFWVYVTGVILAFAFVSLLLNRYVKESALLLAGMLGIFVLTIHIPAVQQTPAAMANLLKDFAMMGAALTYASHHSAMAGEEVAVHSD